MNKDRVQGAIDQVVGRAKRKAGDLTGNTKLKVEGIAQQVKGNLKVALGETKDVVRNANAQSKVEHDPTV